MDFGCDSCLFDEEMEMEMEMGMGMENEGLINYIRVLGVLITLRNVVSWR